MNAEWLRKNERFLVAGIVLLAVLHGLFYIYIVPPWQHYDEPMHFEYVWMIVDRGELPEPEVYDGEFRSALVRSMIEHDFYAGLPVPDPDNLEPLPAGLQFPQLDDPPLYYLLASLPVRLVRSPDLADQLIAARYASLGLLALSILAAWGIVREITAPGSPFRLAVPLTAAMLPGFIDLMTSVNNDVGAVAVFTLFVWGAVRLIGRGPQPLTILWVLAAAAAAVFTKSTAYLAAPLALIAFTLGLLPGRFRRMAWGVIAVGFLAALVLLLYFREPAFWYRATSQPAPIRTVLSGAPHGEAVLVLDPAEGITPRWLQALNQPLPLEDVYALRGRTITLGVRMWFSASDAALAATPARSPAVNIDIPEGDTQSFAQQIVLTRAPQFYAFTVDVPADALRLWVSASGGGAPPAAGLRLYYDAFVLADGAFPPDVPANLAAGDDRVGEWGGVAFANLLRNGSGEETWPAFRPWADNVSASILPSNVRLSMLLQTILDREGAGWYYQGASVNIFETFWGRFGWGHVPLPGGRIFYLIFAGLTLLSVLGVVVYPFEKGRRIPVDILLFLGLCFVVVWIAALARGAIFIFVEHVFQPSARYGLPAIVPTVLLLVAGWLGLGRALVRTARIPAFYLVSIYLYLLLALDVAALWGIARYYAAA